MKKIKYIECPVHGKATVRVETEKHVEFFAAETAKCPVCARRLPVKTEVES